MLGVSIRASLVSVGESRTAGALARAAMGKTPASRVGTWSGLPNLPAGHWIGVMAPADRYLTLVFTERLGGTLVP